MATKPPNETIPLPTQLNMAEPRVQKMGNTDKNNGKSETNNVAYVATQEEAITTYGSNDMI
jgi:hypothetical protein